MSGTKQHKRENKAQEKEERTNDPDLSYWTSALVGGKEEICGRYPTLKDAEKGARECEARSRSAGHAAVKHSILEVRVIR